MKILKWKICSTCDGVGTLNHKYSSWENMPWTLFCPACDYKGKIWFYVEETDDEKTLE